MMAIVAGGEAISLFAFYKRRLRSVEINSALEARAFAVCELLIDPVRLF